MTEHPRCMCGESWRLNAVHREKTPCFDYIEHRWVGMTEEEIRHSYGKDLKYRDGDYERYARVIEAKLKEKNYD